MANYVYATDPRKPISIGFEGENDARTIVFDISRWIEDYGNGTALLVHQRPGDVEPYPCATEQKAGTVEWTVQQADLVTGGYGRAQISYKVGDNIVARSPIYKTVACASISTAEAGEPGQDWINDVLDAAAQAETSATNAANSAETAKQAETAATQAATSAAADANAAAQSEANASKSASAAAGSATAASDSATAAAGSAETAQTAATTATDAAGQAQASQTAAAGSASAAAESATQAAGSQTAAKNSEDAAAASATAAAGSAEQAAQSVAEATQAAQEAKTSATAAGIYYERAADFAAASENSAALAQEYSGKPPIIQNDTWWTWDAESDAYKDTGHLATGEGAGFGEITATVGATVGTPSVSVEASGPDTAKNLAFTFTNLKGEPGQSVGSIQRTAGTGAPGTTDTYTMYDDGGGVIGTFTVYNGTDGTGSGDFKADGSVPMTGNFNAGGHRLTNVGAPTAASDAVRQSDLQALSDEIDHILDGTTPVVVPVATSSKAGTVMPGEHLSVEADGTLNAEWPDLSGYLTEIPAEYVTSTELAGYGYITADTLDGYATESWVNGKGFLTSIPSEYITETELDAKGYLTAIPDEYVTETELTEKGYITSTALNGYATTAYVDGKIGTINTALDSINGEVI